MGQIMREENTEEEIEKKNTVPWGEQKKEEPANPSPDLSVDEYVLSYLTS